jgi:hypothetical protein
MTDSVIVLNTDLAVKAFAGHGQIKFGGALSVAAGPVGREGDASAHIGDGGVAACYSYSHSRGLFAGISLQGAIFMTRHADNEKFYGYRTKSSDILSGKVTCPDFPDLRRLHEVLRLISSGKDISSLEGFSKDAAFRDVKDVSFNSKSSNSTSLYSPKKFDDDLDSDEDDSTAKPNFPASGKYSSFGWGQDEGEDEDEREFQKTMMATSVAKAATGLAPGWVEVASADGFSAPYYWHEATGKTQWEKPTESLPEGWVYAGSGAEPYYYNTITKVSQWERPISNVPPPPKAVPADILPGGWVYVDAKPSPYYWNKTTNVTQWERPVENAPPPPKMNPVEDSLPEGWVHVDAKPNPYYWNKATNVTQWERPISNSAVLKTHKTEPPPTTKANSLPLIPKPPKTDVTANAALKTYRTEPAKSTTSASPTIPQAPRIPPRRQSSSTSEIQQPAVIASSVPPKSSTKTSSPQAQPPVPINKPTNKPTGTVPERPKSLSKASKSSVENPFDDML